MVIKIPTQLKKPGNRFILLKAKDKTPLEKKWQDEKEVFFRMIDKTQQRNKKVPLSVIEKEIGEAIKSVRRNSKC